MLRCIWLSGIVIALDQVSKFLIDNSLRVYESVPLLPFFQLTYLRNEGAAFSFLAQQSGWQRWFFVALSSAASVALAWWLSRLKSHQIWEACAVALILGGAVGNLIDRLWLGYVIDFLDVYYANWHFPAFNVADSAISIGVAMLILDGLRQHGRAPTEIS